MKKIIIFSTLLIGCLAIAAKTIIITACEWQPYTSEKVLEQGFLSDLAVSALKKVGYQAEVHFYPWARAYEMTKNGNADALLGASYLKQREDFFSYPEKLWTSQASIWCRTDNPISKFESIEKLAPASIGVMNGSNFVKELEKIKGIDIETVPDGILNVKKLAAGRMPYLLESSDNMNFLLSGELASLRKNIKMLTPPYMEDHLYLVFSKKNPEWQQLTKDFNNGLKQLKANGDYKKIVEKHKMINQ